MTVIDTPPNATPQQPGLTDLVSGILTDAQTLVRQQAVMLKAEIKDDVRRATMAAQYSAAGVGLASVGVLFLAVAAVNLLAELVPTLPRSAAWGIAGFALVAFGVIALLLGRRAFARFNPMPDKSLNALKENVSWFTNKRPN